MKSLVTAGSSNLTLLGVSAADQERMPYAVAFPARLNPVFGDYWLRLVIEVREGETLPMRAWDVVVKSYIRYCIEREVNPFNPANVAGNAAIMSTLMRCRRKIVKYIDAWGLLERHTLKRNRGESLYLNLTDGGLTIRSSITLRNTDLTAIRQELDDRLFYKFRGPYSMGKIDWRHRLQGYPVYIGYSSANNFEGILWYEITLDTQPGVPLVGNDVLFDHEERLEHFIRQEMWHPLVRTLRFRTLGSRISSF